MLGGDRDAGQLDRLAVDEDQAAGRLLDAGEDLHQRRLAGAVLAHQDVDLARQHIEGDVVEGRGPREDLGHVLRAQRHPCRRHGGLVGRDRGIGHDRHCAASSTGTSVIVLTSIWGWLKVRIVNTPVTVTGLPRSACASLPATPCVFRSATTRLLISDPTLPYSVWSLKSPNVMKPAASRMDESSPGIRVPT